MIRGVKDQLLERIAERREKNPRLAKRIAKDTKRIGELKRRRERIEQARRTRSGASGTWPSSTATTGPTAPPT